MHSERLPLEKKQSEASLCILHMNNLYVKNRRDEG